MIQCQAHQNWVAVLYMAAPASTRAAKVTRLIPGIYTRSRSTKNTEKCVKHGANPPKNTVQEKQYTMKHQLSTRIKLIIQDNQDLLRRFQTTFKHYSQVSGLHKLHQHYKLYISCERQSLNLGELFRKCQGVQQLNGQVVEPKTVQTKKSKAFYQ